MYVNAPVLPSIVTLPFFGAAESVNRSGLPVVVVAVTNPDWEESSIKPIWPLEATGAGASPPPQEASKALSKAPTRNLLSDERIAVIVKAHKCANNLREISP